MSARAAPCDERPGRPLAFDLSVTIGRPPAVVFTFFADVQEHEPIPRGAGIRMTKIPPGPTAAGTRWQEQVRLMPGCWMRVDSVVTEIDQPAVLGMDFRSIWCTGHLTYTVEATPEGSILQQRETLRPRWPLRPLAAWVDARPRPPADTAHRNPGIPRIALTPPHLQHRGWAGRSEHTVVSIGSMPRADAAGPAQSTSRPSRRGMAKPWL